MGQGEHQVSVKAEVEFSLSTVGRIQMYDWTVLNHTVSESLAGGHVGAPVFVRWTAAAANSGRELKPLLAEMCAYAGSWLSAGPSRLYATGEEADGHLSLALEYDNGASALLAITLTNGRPCMNLAVLGARGAIYHTDSTILSRADGTASEFDTEILSSAALSLEETVAAIERSLAASLPVPLSPSGDQP